jgi:hypothetical protein
LLFPFWEELLLTLLYHHILSRGQRKGFVVAETRGCQRGPWKIDTISDVVVLLRRSIVTVRTIAIANTDPGAGAGFDVE